MGNSESAGEKESGTWMEKVDCSPYICHDDIGKFINDRKGSLLEKDRRLLQETLSLVTSENRWVWRDAEITVYGVNLNVVFYSGDRTNEFVVYLNSADKPTHVTEARGWRLCVRDGFKKVWGWLGDAVKVAGSLTGPLAKLAI
ncbi:uncharacterized protein LOC118416765 [Branchiostoma floridae]|uniref:Uncharacterized protein LOC118416765 n=1 Tax=Branchiostoma floridae TaxID=7739 RepID=A0A9J7L979_BRAFL|nr:uncharacterized protein LOC118416765 [Branchiostoma floridae]